MRLKACGKIENGRRDGCSLPCGVLHQWFEQLSVDMSIFLSLSILPQDMLSTVLSVIELGISGSTSEVLGEDGVRQVVFKGSKVYSHAVIQTL